MSKKYRVNVDGFSFIVTITEAVAEGGIALIIFCCVLFFFGYLVFGSPFLLWPMLYKEFQMEDGSHTFFWILVFAQAFLAIIRAISNAKRDKSTFFLELLLESVFFYLTFEIVHVAFAYFGLRTLTDPNLIQEAREAGLYDIDFITSLKGNLSRDLSSPLQAAFLAYIGGAIPTAVSCVMASVLRSLRNRD